MQPEPIPPKFWRKHIETRRDVINALERMEAVGNLPVELWAAWVWHETDIPTGLIAWDYASKDRGGQKWRLSAPLVKLADGSTSTKADYYFVSQICDRENVWVRRLGVAAMSQMLTYLDDEAERQHGWNALHGVRQGDAPNVPALRAMAQNLAEQKSLTISPNLPVHQAKRVIDAPPSGMKEFFASEEPERKEAA